MTIELQQQLRSGSALQEIVQEATTALLAMDADRLEELARCCKDLNREFPEPGQATEAAIELERVSQDVKLLGRVLFETRANLVVLTRLHLLRLRDGNVSGTGDGSRGSGTTIRFQHSERTGEYGDN